MLFPAEILDLFPGFEKSAASRALRDLVQAKEESDRGNYVQKADIVRRLIAYRPQDWIIDSDEGHVVGLTHVPTRFRLHLPKRDVPSVPLVAMIDYNRPGKESGHGSDRPSPQIPRIAVSPAQPPRPRQPAAAR